MGRKVTVVMKTVSDVIVEVDGQAGIEANNGLVVIYDVNARTSKPAAAFPIDVIQSIVVDRPASN